MPVCLKCGKSIDGSRTYCEDCGTSGEEQVERLFGMVEGSPYRRKRRSDSRLLVVSMLALLAVMVCLSIALAASIPSSPAFTAKAQAAVCRTRMRSIEEAVEKYRELRGEYPEAGRVDDDHPLVVDAYIEVAPRCPTTDHYFVIEQADGSVKVVCDSGREGHEPGEAK